MNVLTLRAVQAAGRRRPGPASKRPPSVPGPGALGLCQHARPGVAWSSETRGPRPQVLGPRPGIAWGRLFHVSTPTRAVSSARRSGARHPSQCPNAHRPSAPKSVPLSCNRAAVRLAPSESVPRGTRAVSAPRAVGCALVALGRLPTEPSRATSVPASGPRAPSRANLSVPGAATRPPATRHPPPRHTVRPVPIPTQARASATGGSGTGQHVATLRPEGGVPPRFIWCFSTPALECHDLAAQAHDGSTVHRLYMVHCVVGGGAPVM